MVRRGRIKPRRGPARDRDYLNFLREEGKCVACPYAGPCRLPDLFRFASDVCDPAHGPVNGRSSKGPDSEAIPLCRRHHDEQGRLGWSAFQLKYSFDRAEIAAMWYRLFLIWQEHTGANPQ